MKEGPLVVFTLLAQTGVGIYNVGIGTQLILFALGKSQTIYISPIIFISVLLLTVLAMALSFLHLGTPLKGYRAIFNIHTSWLSREIFTISLFAACVFLQSAYSLIWKPSKYPPFIFLITSLLGLVLVLCISKAYMLRTMPAWKSWSTFLSFLSASFINGSITLIVMFSIQSTIGFTSNQQTSFVYSLVTLLLGFFLAIEVFLVFWRARFDQRPPKYGEIHLNQPIASSQRLFVSLMFILGFALAIIVPNFEGIKNTPVQTGLLVSAFIVIISAEISNRINFYKVSLGSRSE